MGNTDVHIDSLSRGSDTFTPDRLDIILKNERISYDHRTNVGTRIYRNVIYASPEKSCQIDTGYFQFEQVDGGLRCYSDEATKIRAEEFCRQLYGHDSSVPIAAIDLDAKLSKVFRFKFEPLKDSQTIIQQACDLVERMPARPLELNDIPTTIPLEYHVSSVVKNVQIDSPLWEQLQATTYVSSTVLRAALGAVLDPSGTQASLMDIINIIAKLLETVSQLTPTGTDVKTTWRSFIVRAFLWTTWQRCLLIYFQQAARDALIEGSLDGKKGELTLRGTMPSPGVTIHEMSKQCAGLGKSAYICGWNFELLRSNPVCIGADFRGFHQRYNAAFGSYSARCFAGQSHACKGDSPRKCQRFHGMVIEDQSAHDQSCSRDCRRLIWAESSYRILSGSRAVRLMESDGSACESIQYCNASDQTLAISHVWSHGQGGRPETGFNHCLHRRYSTIAKSLNCNSYWIDATCIPNSHELRNEAIANINGIFMNAKVMLVCDRDIMELDASSITSSVCETLLITAIVSDWNTRAWTFFEAFRARRTIHLLCKSNAVVSLKQVIQTVYQKSMLDIGILLLAVPHFLPPLDDGVLAEVKSGAPEDRQDFQAGYLPIETSSNLLSYRPASRPGDEIVIWSLLMSEKTIFHDAETFWKSMQGPALQLSPVTRRIFSSGALVKTGYLVSRAPRLKTRGLGWAPASPTFRFSAQSVKDGLNGFDGGHSERGYVTPNGFVADWLLWKFDNASFHLLSDSRCVRNLARIRMQFLKGYRWGAILCPIEQRYGYWWEDGNRLRRTTVVVCATNEMDGLVVEKYTFNSTDPTKPSWDENKEVIGWEWRGVYEWDDIEPLPEWRRVEKLLIV